MVGMLVAYVNACCLCESSMVSIWSRVTRIGSPISLHLSWKALSSTLWWISSDLWGLRFRENIQGYDWNKICLCAH